MRSTFWPNRILERQSCQIRYTCLKFSSKRENSALSIKIFQNALFRSCAARFSQIAFLSIKVLKIVTLAWNSLQNGKTYRFPWKLYKTLFSGHAQHVLAKSHLGGSKLSKSSHGPQILSKKVKQCTFHENCTNSLSQGTNSTFWPNRIFKGQTSQSPYTCPKVSSKRDNSSLFMKILPNVLFRSCAARFGQTAFLSVKVHTGLKFTSKRENSALAMKIVQNALFRSCAGRFGQIKFVSVKVLKIVTLASNSLQNGKTVRFSRKLYTTLFSGDAQHVLVKSHF